MSRKRSILLGAACLIALAPGAGADRALASSADRPSGSSATETFVCAGHVASQSLVLSGASPHGGAARVAGTALGGRVHGLIVSAGFSDEAAAHPEAPSYAGRITDPAREGSLSHFYEVMSGGCLHLTGDVLPRRYGARQTASSYVSRDPDSRGEFGRFLLEVLERADRDVDFGEYDNDGPDGIPNSGDDDGIVDFVFVTVASTPEGFIYHRATGVAGLGYSSYYFTRDARAGGGVIMVSGARQHGCMAEEGNFGQTVGALAHEFGHALGLPDLYDLSYEGPEDDSAGIGRWGLMAWGAHGWDGTGAPTPFCAWSLEQLGWLGPGNERLVEVTGPVHEGQLRDPLAGGRVYKVFLLPDWSSAEQEELTGRPASLRQDYLLLERRERSAHVYNRGLPGEGVLVWHARPAMGTNRDEGGKLLDLVCADGLYADAGYPLGRAPDRGGGDNLDFWAHDAAWRAARGGNLGDATDPFDGVRFTEVAAGANPSSLSLGAFADHPVSTPRVSVSRRGGDLVLDVEPPRWAGRLGGRTDWTGTILVDGDLGVPEGTGLVIHGTTRVLFAGADRLRSGVDPTRVELTIRGNLVIEAQGASDPPVVLGAAQAGDSWYGLVLDPGPSQLVDVPQGSVDIRDAVHGVEIAGAASPDLGLHLAAVRLLDDTEGERAGNGDGRLQAGEAFQLELAFDNWTLNTVRDVRLEVSWGSSPVTATWLAARSGAYGPSLTHTFSVYPGGQRTVAMPALSVSSTAGSGDVVALHLRLYGIGRTWEQDLSWPVASGPPFPDLALSLPGQVLQGSTVLASRGQPIEARADVSGGSVVQVEVVVRPETDSPSVSVGRLAATSASRASYRGTFELPSADPCMLALRGRTADGRVFFAPGRWRARALVDEWLPVLAVLTDADALSARTASLRRLRTDNLNLLQTALTERDLAANALSVGELVGAEQPIMGQYLGADRAVVWLAGEATAAMQEALADYLEAGGRLLIASTSFHSGLRGSLQAWLPFEGLSFSRALIVWGTGVLDEVAYLDALHFWLRGLSEPAQALLVDADGRASGLSLERGATRLAYLPFDLSRAGDGAGRLVSDVLDYLLAPWPGVAAGVSELVIDDVRQIEPVVDVRYLWPRLEVRNAGTAASGAYDVLYQVWQGGEVAVEHRVSRPPLGAGERAAVPLPAWRPADEDDYELRFSLLPAGDAGPVATRTRPVRVVDLQGGFALQALPGNSLGNGAGLFDADDDGDLDLYVVRRGAANSLYRNEGGTFGAAAAGTGLEDDGNGRGLAVGDHDGDGDLDVYLVNEGPNRLFSNRGGGRYAEVTAAADRRSASGVPLSDPGSGRSAGFLDYDGDGDLDLCVVNAMGPNRFYVNSGGAFSEMGAALGLADRGDGRGLAIGDYDDDGDPDLFVANQTWSLPSRLCRNDASTGGRFVTVEGSLGLRGNGNAVAGVFGDYDGDGDLDLFISNQVHANELWRNDGAAGFVQTAGEAGYRLGEETIGAAFFDYDNDGDLDLATTSLDAQGLGDELYHNRGAAGFVAVGERLGLRRHSSGRALAFGDCDQDGRQDLLVASPDSAVFYRNEVRLAHWLQVDLRGLPSNAHGLGATVELAVAGGVQRRELQSSNGYGSQVQPRLHFGLGASGWVDSLRVTWPDGVTSLQGRVRADQMLVLAYPGLGKQAGDASAGAAADGPSLQPAWPNPFNQQSVIPFSLDRDGPVRLEIYGVSGQRVATLVDGVLPAGTHRRVWDGRDGRGRPAATGVYLCRLTVGDQARMRRLLLLK